METVLARIAAMAKERPKEKFTTLAHHINVDNLAMAHVKQSALKAPGVDKVTKDEYEERLYPSLQDLVERMKRQAYKPQPVRRTYIEKPGTSKLRPLGIPAYEDKLVQSVMADIMSAIFEQDFLDCSFGFRPNRSCHMALKVLSRIVETKKVNYVVDVDIKGFFDHVDHEWLMKFVGHRIADTSFLRLINRFLKAGVMEAGVVQDTPAGTPQGGVISPVLANLYLHFVLDLWFELHVKKVSRGEAYLVRYADDFVCCFQYESDATSFYAELKERLAKFNLEIAEDKTKVIKFGRVANEGETKAETFNFLGFTHYCSTSRSGSFRVKRRTMNKKFRLSLRRCKEWLKKCRHFPISEIRNKLNEKLRGHYQYFGMTDNYKALERFQLAVKRLLFKWLNRRSQRRTFEWQKFDLFLTKWPLARPSIRVNVYDFDTALLAVWNGVVKSRVR